MASFFPRLLVLVSAQALVLSCGVACNRNTPPSPRSDSPNPGEARVQSPSGDRESLLSAIDYLMDQQGDDGGWHSEAYGTLRPGAAVTALVLFALSDAEQWLDDDQRDALVRGMAFLEPGIDARGFVANPDGGPDFTNYATAMVLIAARNVNVGLTAERRGRLIDYLVASQLGAEHEYDESHPDFGGWDLSGWMIGPRRSAGTNISVSSLAVEALAGVEERTQSIADCLDRCEKWLAGCQNLPGDGGFYFHPEKAHDGNKAGWPDESREQARSYGTSTCDGLRALIALGTSVDDERVESSIDWLLEHAESTRVPGFENSGPDQGWDQGLRYYYYFSLATVAEQLDGDRLAPIRSEILERLRADQHDDGYWENPVARMREDDPLIATCFAIIALNRLIESSDRGDRE